MTIQSKRDTMNLLLSFYLRRKIILPIKYIGLLLFTSLLWGGNFVAGKFLVSHATPLFLTELRWLIAVICLFPFVWWKEGSILFPRKALLPLIIMGITGVLLFNFLMFVALKYTTADNVGLLSTLNPISIAIASFFFYREKVTFQQLVGMGISLFGILIVMSKGKMDMITSLQFNIGDMYMIGAVLIWGLYSVSAKLAMKYVSPYKSTLWAGIFGVVMILPFTVKSSYILNPTPAFWIATFYTAIGATVLAMIFWNIGIQKVGNTKSGMFLNFNPIFTAILAYLLLDERMNSSQFLGAFIVIFGVIIFTTKSRKLDSMLLKNRIRAN